MNMASITPLQVFPNYALLESSDPAPSQGIFIPLTDLEGYSAIEANSTTGDGRALVYALIEHAQANIMALADADKPSKMTLTKAAPSAIGQLNQVRQNYTASFDIAVPATGDLVPES